MIEKRLEVTSSSVGRRGAFWVTIMIGVDDFKHLSKPEVFPHDKEHHFLYPRVTHLRHTEPASYNKDIGHCSGKPQLVFLLWGWREGR